MKKSKPYSIYTDPKSPQYILIKREIMKGFKEGWVDVSKIIRELDASKKYKGYKIHKSGVHKVYSHLIKELQKIELKKK